MDTEFRLGKMKINLEMDDSDDYKHANPLNTTELGRGYRSVAQHQPGKYKALSLRPGTKQTNQQHNTTELYI